MSVSPVLRSLLVPFEAPAVHQYFTWCCQSEKQDGAVRRVCLSRSHRWSSRSASWRRHRLRRAGRLEEEDEASDDKTHLRPCFCSSVRAAVPQTTAGSRSKRSERRRGATSQTHVGSFWLLQFNFYMSKLPDKHSWRLKRVICSFALRVHRNKPPTCMSLAELVDNLSVLSSDKVFSLLLLSIPICASILSTICYG